MARVAEWWGSNWRAKWCSYKRTTILVCSINIFVALYVLHSYTSTYMYTRNDTQKDFRYTPDQVRKMEESNRIRKQLEPVQLIELLKGLKEEFFVDEKVVQVPQQIKQKIADEILTTLKGVNARDNATVQRDAVESWRRKKLKEARELVNKKKSNSTISPGEASVLAQALDVDWAELSEEIGLWIPVAIINKEHHDKPEGEEEFDSEIIAGRRLPPECNVELHTDYGGEAVKWGLTHPKESAYECCMACLNQAKQAGPNDKKCNIWVYCPSETGCYSPDIYQHKNQECWLKYAEKPKMAFKGRYSKSFRNSHPNAPIVVPWMSGVVSV
ncbi:uncharacterized protein LOC132037921 isoform X1 [Lycium ferocissimum]|uniref:uncharacterized protein LOC132037921 isoform X1 n=1 Tax=Lycium ferocissimum TaxID=112874 RepID=UPI0028151530|nr:uncharacterized protein LOC132037921 isoform X1 [Lycium ferocissimum]